MRLFMAWHEGCCLWQAMEWPWRAGAYLYPWSIDMPTNKPNDDSMRNKDKSSQQQDSHDSQKHLRDKDDKMEKGKVSPGASSDDDSKSGYDKNR